MRTRASDDSAVATCADDQQEGLERYLLFRIGVFTLSLAMGYFLTHLLSMALHQLPFWASIAHQKASPATDALQKLHSGFGD